MPRLCPAAFLAGIILPHQKVAGVPKSEISSMPKDSRHAPARPVLFAGCFVGPGP
jgi:hypothetical protein